MFAASEDIIIGRGAILVDISDDDISEKARSMGKCVKCDGSALASSHAL
jgi:hypothetical protein